MTKEAIKEWRVVTPKHSPSGPLGDPFSANQTYMKLFIVLECLALMRLTDAELDRWAKCEAYSIREDAIKEQQRRQRLETT